MASSSTAITTIKVLQAVSEKLACDPAAKTNFSAFLRVLLTQFVATESIPRNVRSLGREFDSKTCEIPVTISMTKKELGHYKRYLRACSKLAGEKLSLSAMANTALCNYCFPGGAARAPFVVGNCIPTAVVPLSQEIAV